MNIGIIGNGTAAIISALALIRGSLFSKKNTKIYCIHNPAIPSLTVGESISPTLLEDMRSCLNSNIDLSELDSTPRFGGDHFWEDQKGNNFRLHYPTGGMHANSEKLSKYLTEKFLQHFPNMFFEYHENIINTVGSEKGVDIFCESGNNYKFDYVIDCSGFPSDIELDSDLYELLDFETVNTVLIYPHFKKYEEIYTEALFHDNGWMFGVPLQHRKAFGYMYNNKITKKEDAIDHFKKLKPVIEEDKLRFITWRQYFRKKIMENNIVFNGNKLYFFEPAQGLPLHYYYNVMIVFSSLFFDGFFSRIDIPHYMNKFHEIQIQKIQDLIALNYVGTNKMTSDFWNQTSNEAKIRLKKSTRFSEYAINCIRQNEIERYWYHDSTLMDQYIKGFNINLHDFV